MNAPCMRKGERRCGVHYGQEEEFLLNLPV